MYITLPVQPMKIVYYFTCATPENTLYITLLVQPMEIICILLYHENSLYITLPVQPMKIVYYLCSVLLYVHRDRTEYYQY